MATLKLSKGSRPYTLKSEREGYFDDRIKEVEEEINSLPPDHPELEAKKSFLDTLKEAAGKAKAKLAKYGPTIWKIHTISKRAHKLAMLRVQVNFKSTDVGEVSSSFLTYMDLARIEMVRLGLDDWENLRDEDGNEIRFEDIAKEYKLKSPGDIAEHLDDAIVAELADEIAGAISEEERGNSPEPLSS